MAGGKGEVVPIVNAASTGKVKFAEALADCESDTLTWNETGPAKGGVPLK